MKNQYKLPKKLTEKLAQDLAGLISSHEGALLSMQLLENLPEQVKISLIANLSMIHNQEVAKFFNLVIQEYPGEKVGLIAERSLQKLKLAGVPNIDKGLLAIDYGKHNFHGAIVSKTRLKGAISLVLSFYSEKQPDAFDICFFTLTFNEQGIREFFFARDLTSEQMKMLIDDEEYLEIPYERALALLNLSYDYNLEFDTLPALGYFIYHNLLQHAQEVPKIEENYHLYYPILASDITPEMLVNGLCLAIRREDDHLIDILTANHQVILPEIGLLLSSKVIEKKDEESQVAVITELIVEEEDGLYQLTWSFKFAEKEQQLELIAVEELDETVMEWTWLEEALSLNNLTVAYYVLQPHAVQLFIESLEGIEFFQDGGEMDFYKWWDLDTVLKDGLSFQGTVLADLILGEEELVIIANDEDKLKKVQEMLAANLSYELELLDEEMPFEVVYQVFGRDKMTFNQLIEEWVLTGSNRKEQLKTWLNTKFTELDGMTPLEASSSGEGATLLWALVKKISKLSKKSSERMVDYRTLLKAVGWGKKVGKKSVDF